MGTPIPIRSEVDPEAWEALRRLAEASRQPVSELLTEAIRDYLRRRQLDPDMLRHLEDSVQEHRELGRRLAE